MKLLVTYCAFVLCLLLTACGKPQRNTGDFEHYVAAFEEQAAAHGHTMHIEDLTVEYGDTGGKPAICKMGKRLIIVKESTWKTSLSESSRLRIMFHELGHCILERGHAEAVLEDGAPASLMAPLIPDDGDWKKWKAHYLVELFATP
jgi:hypothetical protein